MRVLVTGAAGFIGSTLSDRLLAEGHEVIGVDSFTEYYDESFKRANISTALTHDDFTLVEEDLVTADLAARFADVDVVWHLAGQPGVRLSWSDGFETYDRLNVLATQRVLEGARAAGVNKIVYASSSSVYGNAERFPTEETDRPEPFSPYGVTKLAAEHLCTLYAANWGLPTVSLRFFTVYGPRQRPDMAAHRLIEAALNGTEFPMFGDGRQERSFTFVNDVVDALYRAGTIDTAPGSVFNVAGREGTTLKQLIDVVGEAVGEPVKLDVQPAAAGDAEKTGGSTERIEAALGWTATTSVHDGIAAQVAHHRQRRESV
jgi:nucleoside-diphosphate-sugar epimerase